MRAAPRRGLTCGDTYLDEPSSGKLAIMSGTAPTMDEAAATAVERLRAHEKELRALGVRSLSVFGSIARGDGCASSDIDVGVRLGSEFARGGFEYFGKLERLRDQLSSILGRPVDVIEEPVEAEPLQRAIDRERLSAF